MKKKIIVPVSIVLVIALIGTAIFGYGKVQDSNKVIEVYPLSSVSTSYWGENSSLEGTLTTDVSQNVYLSKTDQVKDVFVELGDYVDIGDPLFEYDTTLLELEVETQGIQVQTVQLTLNNAYKKLEKLLNTKAVADSKIKAISRPLTTTGSLDGTEVDMLDFDTELEEGESVKTYLVRCTEETIVTPAFINKVRGYDAAGKEKIGDPIIVVFQVGDNSEWHTLYGSQLSEPRVEYSDTMLIEFKNNGNILNEPKPEETDETDETEETDETDDSNETEETDESEEQPTTEDPGIVDPGIDDPGIIDPGVDDPGAGMTKDELNKAITDARQEIRELETSLKKAQFEYEKLQKKFNNSVLTATVKGTVSTLGDPEEGPAVDGSPFLTVEGEDGVYLKGTINEFQLQSMEAGDPLLVTSYMTGASYNAVITEITPYPTEKTYYSSYEVASSVYPYIAYIEDSTGLSSNDYWVEIQLLKSDEDESSGTYIYQGFVKSENGIKYVYKEDENGRLKKVQVQTGRNLWGSYVKIYSPELSEMDNIAFPYGKNIKEGVKTKAADKDFYSSLYY